MKLQNVLHLIFPFILLSTLSITAQSITAQNNQDESFYISEGYIESENFDNSIKLYERVLDEEPDNPDVNFKLGFCYLNTPDKKHKAIPYIQKAVGYFEKKKKRIKKHKKDYLEYSFYLAKAYYASGKLDTALYHYKRLKQVSDKYMTEVINKEIVNISKAFSSDADSTKIQNLGDIINSQYSDHSAFVSADESVLLFTSRRENNYSDVLYEDDQYDENIYICYRKPDGSWTKPKSIGNNINTSDHDAVIGLSADAQQLFMYKEEDKGSIYVSNLQGDVWLKPAKLGPNINTRHRETSASISYDGSTLYFTSDRKGGFGGLDIYYSEKQADGTWGKAVNLGPGINTSGDERSPFINSDGKTLYFSSEGHVSIGGFDVFKSTKNEFGTWTKPQNIGYPINTISDDIYYMSVASGKRSYFTSAREGGLGKTDIYAIDLKTPAFEPEIVMFKGTVSVCEGALPEVSIVVKDVKTNKVDGIYASNSTSGKFLFVLKSQNSWKVEFYANDKMFYSEIITVSDSTTYEQMHKDLKIPIDAPCYREWLAAEAERLKKLKEKPVEVEIHDILFTDNIELGQGNKELDTIAKYLANNPTAVIKICSYADAKGRASYNYNLSLKRANYVKDYLLNLDVKPYQLEVEAYGEENPIAMNKTSGGRWNKNGRKYNRRIEFKVIQQGKNILVVKPITDIPVHLINDKYDKNYKKNKDKHVEITY